MEIFSSFPLQFFHGSLQFSFGERALEQRIGRIENGLGRAVIFNERDLFRTAEKRAEIGEVLDRGAAESVDQLAIVSDDENIRLSSVSPQHRFEKCILHTARILMFVHEHIQIIFAHERFHFVGILCELHRVFQDIVIVHERTLDLERFVFFIELHDLARAFQALDTGFGFNIFFISPFRAPRFGAAFGIVPEIFNFRIHFGKKIVRRYILALEERDERFEIAEISGRIRARTDVVPFPALEDLVDERDGFGVGKERPVQPQNRSRASYKYFSMSPMPKR